MSGWRLDGDKDAMNLDVIGPKGRVAMMDCENFEVSDDELEANAHLIAAAPDMLEALEGMVEMATHHMMEPEERRDILSNARAAIAKAKGQA